MAGKVDFDMSEPESYSSISDDISDYKEEEEISPSKSSEDYNVDLDVPTTESSYHSSDSDFEIGKPKVTRSNRNANFVKKPTRSSGRNVRFDYEGSDSSSEHVESKDSEVVSFVEQDEEYDERDICYYTPAITTAEAIDKIITHVYGRTRKVGVELYKMRLEGDDFESSLLGTLVEEDVVKTEELDKNPTESTKEKTLYFLIKWKGKSYIHCTWETEESLKSRSMMNTKKLDNYMTLNQGILFDDSDTTFVENRITLLGYICRFQQLEYILCFSEETFEHELISIYHPNEYFAKADFIKEGITVLCRWTDLSASDSTWEDITLVDQLFPNAMIDFVKTKAKSYYALDLRRIGVIKFYTIPETPFFIQHSQCKDSSEDSQSHESCNILRDYQLEGVNWLTASFCKKKSVILADEMGLGKTVQVISYLSILSSIYNVHGPFLIVVPLSTVDAWKTHFKMWCPYMKVVSYTGNAESRDLIRQYEMYSYDSNGSVLIGFNVVITTYEMILKDKKHLEKFDWVSLIVDEAHRLKNTESLLYISLKSFYSFHRLLMTGTPIQNNLRELWAILHFIHPDRYIFWEEFEEKFSHVDPREGYAKLQKEISPYILRRMKKDVEKSLPPKVEQILRVDMTKRQKEVYKNVLTKNYAQLSKEQKCNISGFINTMMQLKKCCNHTSLIIPLDLRQCTIEDLLRGSGKLILLDKLLGRFYNDGSRVLIFSQMVMILDVLSAYLIMRGYSFQRLDGNVGEAQRKQAMEQFNAPNSPNFCFLLSTKAGGLGINLVTADIVIIFDSDWNPQNDLQAQARAHRIGQKKTVKIYRLVTKNSVDENIVERARKKMILNHLVIQTMDTRCGSFFGYKNNTTTNKDKKEISAILKFGAENLFREEGDNDDADLQALDLDHILAIAELRESESHTNTSSAGEELLSSFKVANFKASDYDQDEPAEENLKNWSEIIPENLILKIKEEEENEKMAQLYLPPRKRTVAARAIPYREQPVKSGVSKAKVEYTSDTDEHSEYEMSETDQPDEGEKKSNLSMFSYKIACLNKLEIKRFVTSYKKFPLAWERAAAVAKDANLTNKPIKDVIGLGKWLHNIIPKISKSVDSVKKKPTNISRSHRLHVNGMIVNGEELRDGEEYLAPFNDFFRKYFSKNSTTNIELSDMLKESNLIEDLKLKNFVWNGVEWDCQQHDLELILGLFFVGLGNWSAMMDQGLLENVRNSGVNNSIISKKLKTRLNTMKEAIRNINNPNCKSEQGESKSEKKHEKKVPTKKATRKRPAKKPTPSGIESYFPSTSKDTQQITTVKLSKDMFEICRNLMKSRKDDFCVIEKLFKENGLEELKSVPEFDQCLYKLGSHINEIISNYSLDDTEDEPFSSTEILTSALWSFVSRFTSATPEALYDSFKIMEDEKS